MASFAVYIVQLVQ